MSGFDDYKGYDKLIAMRSAGLLRRKCIRTTDYDCPDCGEKFVYERWESSEGDVFRTMRCPWCGDGVVMDNRKDKDKKAMREVGGLRGLIRRLEEMRR